LNNYGKDKITYFRSILYRTGKILGDAQSIRKKELVKELAIGLPVRFQVDYLVSFFVKLRAFGF
jgi:hypothetical protein